MQNPQLLSDKTPGFDLNWSPEAMATMAILPGADEDSVAISYSKMFLTRQPPWNPWDERYIYLHEWLIFMVDVYVDIYHTSTFETGSSYVRTMFLVSM